jgi:DNA-3-methyladenine glycosylase
VYFTYGMHFCFNVVTEREGTPGAVLIRGLDGIELANGPARLCRTLSIDTRQNGINLTTAETLWLEPARRTRREPIIQTTRIGIRVAQTFPWRFYLAGSPGVSKRDLRTEREYLAAYSAKPRQRKGMNDVRIHHRTNPDS